MAADFGGKTTRDNGAFFLAAADGEVATAGDSTFMFGARVFARVRRATGGVAASMSGASSSTSTAWGSPLLPGSSFPSRMLYNTKRSSFTLSFILNKKRI